MFSGDKQCVKKMGKILWFIELLEISSTGVPICDAFKMRNQKTCATPRNTPTLFGNAFNETDPTERENESNKKETHKNVDDGITFISLSLSLFFLTFYAYLINSCCKWIFVNIIFKKTLIQRNFKAIQNGKEQINGGYFTAIDISF